MKKFITILHAIRVNQWIKNLSLYAAIIFSGQLFNWEYFVLTTKGFFIFSLISSASYLFNDLYDYNLDRKHPVKKHRPIASGAVSKNEAGFLLILFLILGFFGALSLSFGFFLICLLFMLLHVGYTMFLKKHALFDIVTIAFSFFLRVFAGEVLTGYHIPIWLTFSVIFLSLFIASCKRRSELIRRGTAARPALEQYRKQLLDFYNSTFATATIIAYAMFTFQTSPVSFNPLIRDFLLFAFPLALGRKWMMIMTLPFVIIGIMRYAQLIYEREALGEAPEKIVTHDKTLIVILGLWGMMVVLFTYLL
jgi:4-hydroxybenzoate polyprenyltransferase